MKPDQIALLENPFRPDEHGFVNGNAYILKDAIRARLNEVDSRWQITPPELVAATDDLIVMRGGLTLLGITRYALGTGIITRTKKADNKDVAIEGFELSRNIAKAYKTAASDILPRAAVLYGVGYYLKNMTPTERRSIKDSHALAAWLKKISTPPPPHHWLQDRDAQDRISDKLKLLGLDAARVLTHAEPGKTLIRLSDTILTEAQFLARLDELALDRMKPTAPATVPESSPPTSIEWGGKVNEVPTNHFLAGSQR